MPSCKNCGSFAINPHLHGRVEGEREDLCDVCYWREKAEKLQVWSDKLNATLAGIEAAQRPPDPWRCLLCGATDPSLNKKCHVCRVEAKVRSR